MSSASKLIVGLGNPGPQYEKTRHNMGFCAVDRFVEHYLIPDRPKRKKHYEEFQWRDPKDGQRFYLIKPTTFMNLSGRAVRAALDFYDLGVEDLLVVVDDFHLDTGRVRLRPQGSSAGHNGLKDIERHLKEGRNYARLRLGVGPLPERHDVSSFVLARFSSSDKKLANKILELTPEVIYYWAKMGSVKTMERYNGFEAIC